MNAVWWSTHEAIALLGQIMREQPDCWHLRRNDWDKCRYPRFKGKPAREFRRIWEALREAAMGDREAYIALGEHHPDDIINAMLNEQLVEVEVKELPGGGFRVAA